MSERVNEMNNSTAAKYGTVYPESCKNVDHTYITTEALVKTTFLWENYVFSIVRKPWIV